MAKDEEKKEGEEAAKKGGKMKLIIMVLPLLILVGAGVWFFFLRSTDSGAPVVLPEPVPGTVVTLDPITVNLSGSHFLKLGMAIQPTKAATEVDGSKALDLAISQFSGDTIDDLSEAKGRQEAKEELVARVKLAYLPEGTDFAAATQSTPAPSASADSKGKTTETGAAAAEVNVATMTGEEAIKLASKLTVQPDVYDVYFTEFVMQ
jgi:flagellar FliL protein